MEAQAQFVFSPTVQQIENCIPRLHLRVVIRRGVSSTACCWARLGYGCRSAAVLFMRGMQTGCLAERSSPASESTGSLVVPGTSAIATASAAWARAATSSTTPCGTA